MNRTLDTPESRPWLKLVLVAVAGVLVVLASPFFGSTQLNWANLLSRGSELNIDQEIFLNLRLSRALFAALVGGALGVAGAVFQVTLRNDLATPYTLGVSTAASLGALIAFHLSLKGLAVSGFALMGGLLSVALILAVARWLGGGEGTVTLLLIGITLNLLFASLILVLQYMSDPHETFMIVRWLMGGVDVTGLSISGWLAMVLLPFLVILVIRGQSLNVLMLDDLTARSLGVHPDRSRLIAIGAASFMAAIVVGFAGPIGFIGLIIPHAVRRIVGDDHRFLLPACFAVGGGFLALADIIGRLIGGDLEIPVGIVTALIGGPIFLYIVIRKARTL